MNIQEATFGGGCFWCVEAVMQRLNGVMEVESGYAGGHSPNPTYKEVCKGDTGHAEVVRVKFDSDILSYKDLLTIFMTTHDPTSLNQQGEDVGTQYRSVIFYHNAAQEKVAHDLFKELIPLYDEPIVTQLVPLTNYYQAEAYHQNYYNEHKKERFCHAVITPKLMKLRAKYTEFLKDK